jgi:hypothetical protein
MKVADIETFKSPNDQHDSRLRESHAPQAQTHKNPSPHASNVYCYENFVLLAFTDPAF